jgi:hypothetical protein
VLLLVRKEGGKTDKYLVDQSGSNVGGLSMTIVIIIAVAGGVVLIGGITAAVLLVRKRKNRNYGFM